MAGRLFGPTDPKSQYAYHFLGKVPCGDASNIDVIESVHRKTQRIWTGGAAPSSNPLSFPMYGLYSESAPSSNPLSFPMYGLYNSNKSRFWSRSHGDKGYTYWDFESNAHRSRCFAICRGTTHTVRYVYHDLCLLTERVFSAKLTSTGHRRSARARLSARS